MNDKKISNALVKAFFMAEDNTEGHIIVQLTPNNRSLLVTHQIGNSWESMGLNANESQDRIILDLKCENYEPVYFMDDNDNVTNERMDGMDQDWDNFKDHVEDMEKNIRSVIKR